MAEQINGFARVVARAEFGATWAADDVDDAVQDVLGRLAAGPLLARLASHPNPAAYVFMMLRSRLRDAARRARVRRVTEQEWSAEQTVDPATAALAGAADESDGPAPDLVAALRAAIASLPPRDQALLAALYPVDGTPRPLLREVGAHLGLSACNVATRHHRVLRSLKLALARAGAAQPWPAAPAPPPQPPET